jgi:ribonuclease E
MVPNKTLETPNYKLERLRTTTRAWTHIEASYTMIEEPDDEVGITRREKAKPKQEPVIKGVLPDANRVKAVKLVTSASPAKPASRAKVVTVAAKAGRHAERAAVAARMLRHRDRTTKPLLRCSR